VKNWSFDCGVHVLWIGGVGEPGLELDPRRMLFWIITTTKGKKTYG
jgi:hypothetical protein